MKINKIKRLFEDDMMQMQPIQLMQSADQMMPPAPAKTAMSMNIEAPMEEPQGLDFDMQAAAGDTMPSNISQMTVGDFLQKCKEIDTLVCMGIEAFINNNAASFAGTMSKMDVAPDELKDIEFGAPTEEPQEFAELEFPIEENPNM
jgi:hypothetical protein